MIALYQKIEINDFKSLKKVLLRPSLITVLVGPNSSGKSSALQTLILLKQSAGSSTLNTQGPIINLGVCQDLISKGSNTMTFKISGDLPVWKQFEFFSESRLRYDISYRFGANSNLITIWGTIGSESVKLEGSWDKDEKAITEKVRVKDFEFEYAFQPNISVPITVAHPSKRGEIRSIWRDLSTIVATVHRQLDLTFIVPPFRGQDLPEYGLRPNPELQLTSTSGSIEQASRLASTVAYRRDLENKISNWIEKITGVRVSSELVPGPKVTIRAHPKNPKLALTLLMRDMGQTN